jgi:hypothetical protein
MTTAHKDEGCCIFYACKAVQVQPVPRDAAERTNPGLWCPTPTYKSTTPVRITEGLVLIELLLAALPVNTRREGAPQADTCPAWHGCCLSTIRCSW